MTEFGFEVLEEGPNHFLMKHPNGNVAPIAKRSLTEPEQEKLRTQFSSKAQMSTLEPPPQMSPVPSEPSPMYVPEQPAPPVNGASGSWEPQQQQQAAPIPQAEPMPNPNQDYMNAYGQQMAGIKGAAKVQAKGAQQQADVIQQFQNEMKATQDTYAAKRLELDQRQNQLEQEYKEGKIDPNRFWNEKTGFKGGVARVASLIGLFLGGMAQTKTGVNPAQAMLEKAINNDIEAQKAGMEKTQNLMKLNMDKYGNLQQAETATRLDMLNMFNAQLKMTEANTNSALVKEQSKIAQGELGLKMAELKHKLSAEDTMRKLTAALSSGMNITDQAVSMLPKEMQDKVVKVVNPVDGKSAWMMARTPEAAKEVAEITSKTKTVVGLIDDMIKARSEYKGITNPLGATAVFKFGDKWEKYDQLHSSALQSLKEMSQGARLNEGTMKYLEKIIPHPGSVHTSDDELIRAKKMLTEKLGNEIQTRVFNAPNFSAMGAAREDLKP